MPKPKKILITGVAGFIGYHLAEALIKEGNFIIGIDNMNSYYDPSIKQSRLSNLYKNKEFLFKKLDILDYDSLKKFFFTTKPEMVVNLAAIAGVRHSIKDPKLYIDTNVTGFINILECCRMLDVSGLIYASSSSVYGKNTKIPFSEEDRVNQPISIYAVSKRSNELMAHTYSHLFGLNTTGLRFFTVYGPWGRPDMAMYKFVKKIYNDEEISVYNSGEMYRDFTYIDDTINGILDALKRNYKCSIFNLGSNKQEKLMRVIKIIESELGKKAKIKYLDMQKGDIKSTKANLNISKKRLTYEPKIKLDEGLPKFINWYIDFYKKNI